MYYIDIIFLMVNKSHHLASYYLINNSTVKIEDFFNNSSIIFNISIFI